MFLKYFYNNNPPKCLFLRFPKFDIAKATCYVIASIVIGLSNHLHLDLFLHVHHPPMFVTDLWGTCVGNNCSKRFIHWLCSILQALSYHLILHSTSNNNRCSHLVSPLEILLININLENQSHNIITKAFYFDFINFNEFLYFRSKLQ